jgi:type VI secretion system protein ImpF
MANKEPERSVQQSIIDRLVDLDRDTQVEAPISRAESVRRLKASLRRDIEWLLNTRRTIVEIPEAYSQVKTSVFAFGMPDVTSMRVESPQDEKRLLAALEQAISVFEPRLVAVRVRPHERARGRVHTLHFYIEGTLLIEPAPEHISFDTLLEVPRGAYEVMGDYGA